MQTYHRKLHRLPGYDYATAGVYFLTLCTDGRLPLFGAVCESGMVRNDAGEMIAQNWQHLPSVHDRLKVDEWVVMPDHLHGILWLNAPAQGTTLLRLVGRFKSYTSRLYRDGMRDHHWPPCGRRLWQRSFHDRIVRNDEELATLRQYIRDNPRRWRERNGDER